MPPSSLEFNENNERYSEYTSSVETSVPEIEEYEPKFKQHQEDLHYMFNIEVENESDLTLFNVKKKMHDIALDYVRQGAPFALDYFINEKLLTKDDFTDEDIVAIKPYALSLLKNIRNSYILTNTKELFLETNILTKEEVEMSQTIH